MAPSSDAEKNLNMGAQQQIILYKKLQNIFENCAAQILNFFSAIRAPIVAPNSDDFQICSLQWKGPFFPEKML